MEKEWQKVLDRFPYGIYLVTISTPEGPNGMIASWLTQCSHEPPLIALAIRRDRLSHKQILETEKFCINVLPRESAAMIKRFKIPDWKNKFAGCAYSWSENGLCVLDDCVGFLDCALERAIPVGDHTLFIGRIIAGAMKNADKTVTLSTNDYDGVYRGTWRRVGRRNALGNEFMKP